jgi:hypothetical protein
MQQLLAWATLCGRAGKLKLLCSAPVFHVNDVVLHVGMCNLLHIVYQQFRNTAVQQVCLVFEHAICMVNKWPREATTGCMRGHLGSLFDGICSSSLAWQSWLQCSSGWVDVG